MSPVSPEFEARLAKAIKTYYSRQATHGQRLEDIEGYVAPMPVLEDGSPDMSQWDNVTHIASSPRWKWWGSR